MKLLAPLPSCAALAFIGILPASAQQVVPVGPFDSIELEGGGHVVVQPGDVQRVKLVQGSLAYTRFTVDGEHKLRIRACDNNNNDCPHHYDLKVEITTPRVDALAISGGGAIESAGNFAPARHLALAIEGGGTIDARSLDAERAEAAIDGGGVIKLRAHGELTAAIDGGGEIRYWGNPHVTQAIDGGGEIERGE
jgi:hypothetical protein